MCFFFSSRRRHTRCALVTGVQTCALPICWQGSLAERWMRFRDRRGPLAAVILCCAYAAIVLFGVTEIARLVTGTKGAPFPPVLTLLLTCNALLMVWRMAVRGIFASQFYGWREIGRAHV